MLSCWVQELFHGHPRSNQLLLYQLQKLFVITTSCACQAIWLKRILEELKRILEELNFRQQGPITIHCDNNSTIEFSKNHVLNGRSKHIDVKYHLLRDLTKDRILDFIYCENEDQIVDIMTKPFKSTTFLRLRKLLGVCTVESSL